MGLIFLSVMDATFVSMTFTTFVSFGRSPREGIDVAIQLDFFDGAVMHCGVFGIHCKINEEMKMVR